MYLQLAEGENNGNYAALADSTISDNYVFIPAGFLPEFNKDTYVRADYFLKYDAATADALVNALNQYQPAQMSEGLVSTAVSFIPGVGPIASKGVDIAKKLIAKRQEKVAAGTAKPLFKSGGLLDKLKGKIMAGGGMEKKGAITEPVGGSVTLPGGTITAGYTPAEPTTGATFFQKNKTLLIVGGAALLVGGIYLATRKKRR